MVTRRKNAFWRLFSRLNVKTLYFMSFRGPGSRYRSTCARNRKPVDSLPKPDTYSDIDRPHSKASAKRARRNILYCTDVRNDEKKRCEIINNNNNNVERVFLQIAFRGTRK